MKTLALAVNTPLAGALGWAIFHSLWQGVILAAALGIFQTAIQSARARYAASCLTLLAVLLAFVITLLHCLPWGGDETRVLNPQAFSGWGPLPDFNSNHRLSEFAALIPWLAPVWLLGVCVFYVRHATGWLSMRRMRGQGVCHAPAYWRIRMDELGAQLRVTRPVRLLESILAESPVVMGHIRPVVLVPLGFLSGLPTDQVEAILLHELAHIRRSDYLVNVCQRLIEGLLFYHPAVWWISNVIRTEREHCCDDIVVQLRGNAQAYATALTSLEQNRLEHAAMAATGGNLMRRVKRLLYPKAPGSVWVPVLAALLLMAGSAMVLSAWRQAADPWQKWLNEDVVYIISSEEKAAFEHLRTDAERTHFIEQFWERRNPTPGSVQNVFKEEHYRRIAYANKAWSVHQPGWKTDRGHMYIKYGPPDEIDSHPSGGKYQRPDSEGGETVKTYPFEDWRYRKIEGVGTNVTMEFADLTNSGELRMTMDPNLKVKKK